MDFSDTFKRDCKDCIHFNPKRLKDENEHHSLKWLKCSASLGCSHYELKQQSNNNNNENCYVSKGEVVLALLEKGQRSTRYKWGDSWELNLFEIQEAIDNMESEDVIATKDIYKFYYCESEDDYYIGKRIDTFYYAKYNPQLRDFVWCMSRYLPWGEHIVDENTLWKEYTYPSEPVEINFLEWIRGFINKYFP